MANEKLESPKDEIPGEAKWASELFNFLKLFQRVGRSFVGLVLLEVGWTAIVAIVPKVTLAGGMSGVTLPWIYRDLHFGFRAVSTGELHAMGVAVIALGWLLLSGAYLYLLLPAWWLLRLFGI